MSSAEKKSSAEKDEKIKLLTSENNELKAEIRQLKSVLEQTRSALRARDDSLSNEKGKSDSKSKMGIFSLGEKLRTKRLAVSAESGKQADLDEKDLPKFPKDNEAKSMIQAGITRLGP